MRGGEGRGLRAALGTVLLCWVTSSPAAELDVSGYVSLEPRYFFDEPLFPEQPDRGMSPSAVVAPEFRSAWNRGDDRLTLSPFLRVDADDHERTHADVREAYWLHVDGSWTWRLGIARVFWGVTESRHLVDIVNQTDRVEDIDDEDKLGQPMISVERWMGDAGTLGLYVLPGFRERTFPAADARLRGSIPIASDHAEYESGAGRRRVDAALRWSGTWGGWDIGVSGFHGTSREPSFLPRAGSAGEAVLVPRYEVISQLGLDIQYTRNAWLWKLEGIARSGHGQPFAAFVGGFEYTLFGVAGTDADLGVLLEYQHDGRDDEAPPTPYADNLFVGVRLGMNDPDDTSLLGGIIAGDGGSLAFVEAERRFGAYWKVEVEARLFLDVDPFDPLLGGIRKDSFFTMRLARYL